MKIKGAITSFKAKAIWTSFFFLDCRRNVNKATIKHPVNKITIIGMMEDVCPAKNKLKN